jgi:hypothetical protein
MDITKVVAALRFKYHANMLDVNNVLNQLGLRNDEKAEEKGAYHAMTIINDVLPRLGYDVEGFMNERLGRK